MPESAVENYLKDLAEIWRTGGGVAEESYYGPLENLLNEIGKRLKPRVRCVAQLKSISAGEPDFGLYTANQFQRAGDPHPLEGQKPERGVIECQPAHLNLSHDASSAPKKRYGSLLPARRYWAPLVPQGFWGCLCVGR